MSQQQKIPIPPSPFRYPMFPYPPITPDKLKQMQGNSMPNPNLPPCPNQNNIPSNQFIPPRIFNPYFGGYNMYPVGQPFPPYLPMMRNMPIPPSTSNENSKNSKEADDKNINPPRPFFGRPMPPYFNPSMYMPPTFPSQLPISQQDAKKIQAHKPFFQQMVPIPVQKTMKKQIKPVTSSSSLTPTPREQCKQKPKQPRHADIKPYEPQQPKKKKKKEIIIVENISQRETRQKKQSIEKIMDLVMKQKPLRDRVIKIGKQYQAIVPQSFINEYQYNLKIKLEKKRNLLSRMVVLV